jgi:N-dimethylarginine dimethylaminohydrolase
MALEHNTERTEYIDRKWFEELLAKNCPIYGTKQTDGQLHAAGVYAAHLIMDAFCAVTDEINVIYLDAFHNELARLLSDHDVKEDWIAIAKQAAGRWEVEE